MFEDKLYWSDWSGKEIKVCNKFTGKDRKSLIRETKSRVYGMQIFHPSLFKPQVLYISNIKNYNFLHKFLIFSYQIHVKKRNAAICVY